MFEWPIDLAQGLLHQLVDNNISEPQPLLDVFRKERELLKGDVFDLLLPQEPGLLTCLILFGILTAIFFVLFGVFCIARYLGSCGSELYQKHPTKRSKFLGLSIAFAVNWFLLAFCTIFIVTCILRLGNGGRPMFDGADEVPISIQKLNKTTDRPVRINFNTITITDIDAHKKTQFGEADLLNKYNAIRELGYEFRPVEKDSNIRKQMILFSIIAFIYAAILSTTCTSMIIGCREYLLSYHPMDRSSNSNCCGRIFVGSAMVLFGTAPFVLLVSTFMLAYIQSHNAICPLVQAQAQNQNIELYVNANFEFFDPYNLLDFLNDFLIDRNTINQFNCESVVRPLQGIWISLLFLSIGVLPTVAIILRLSKYFLRMNAANYWNPAETYSTIKADKPLHGAPFKAVFPRY